MLSTLASIAGRYGQYDKPMDKRRITNGEDPFLDELDHMESQIADLNKVRTHMRTGHEHHGCYLMMSVQLLWQPALL